MNESKKLVMQVLDAYKAAVFAKDADAFVALYDQDVCVFDMWGTWSYSGVGAWREMVTEWFGSLGTERVEVSFDDVPTTSARDVVVAYAFVTYNGLSAEGEALRAMQNRLTMVLGKKALPGRSFMSITRHRSILKRRRSSGDADKFLEHPASIRKGGRWEKSF